MSNSIKSSSDPLILACIDGSNVTQSVCDYAAWYGTHLNLPVALLHVIDVPKSNRHDLSGSIGMDSRRTLLDELTRLDEQQSRIANKHGEALVYDAKSHISLTHDALPVHTHLRRGKLLPAIEHFSNKTRLIVLGRRGQDHQSESAHYEGNKGVNIGSQIENVVRAMHLPILVCSDTFIPPTSYMLAFDGSSTAKKAVNIICESKISPAMEGHIVMVGHSDTQNENELYKAKKQMKEAGLDVTTHIIDAKLYNNDVVSALTKFQQDKNISMIVIGAYGHSKWRQFFVGSTTTKLLTKTTTPTLLLR